MRTLLLAVMLYPACVPGGGGVDDTGDGDTAPVGGLPLAAQARCTPGDAPSVEDDGVYAVVRPDVFFPYGPGVFAEDAPVFGTNDAPAYPEASIPDPDVGGQVTVVARAAVSGSLVAAPTFDADAEAPEGRTAAFRVDLDGASTTDLYATGWLTWSRVWPPTFEAGDPLQITFHSRDPSILAGATLQVSVPTSEGPPALDATVVLEDGPVDLTYTAYTDDRTELWVHLRNHDTVAHRVERVVVDGRDVTASACIAVPELPGGHAGLIRIPVTTAVQTGEAHTVAVTFAEAPPVVAARRVMPPHFPVEAWPNSSDCPFPGVNDDRYARNRAAGIDTFFLRPRYDREGCADVDTATLLDSRFREEGAYALPVKELVVPEAARDVVIGRFLGDEVDNRSLETLLDVQKMRQKAEETTWYQIQEPEIVSYVGGSRHRFTGMFAGSTDVQGMDYYVAACAPHITDFGAHPPLRGAYDYLVATRLNHMPRASWMYAQGLSGAWSFSPTPSEIRVQALSVVAAGGKGLMWFQSHLTRAEEHPESWQAMVDVGQELSLLGPWLRTGDPTGMASTDGNAIVEALRIDGGLLLVVIPLETTSGPTDLECAVQQQVPWVLADVALEVDVVVPDDLGVVEVFEVAGGEVRDAQVDVAVRGRTLTVSGVALGERQAGRLLVLAADDTLRARMAE